MNKELALIDSWYKPKAINIAHEVVTEQTTVQLSDSNQAPLADYGGWYGAGGNAPVVRTIYNGEKNFGELGPVIKYVMDHDKLGRRAWQLMLENEALSTIIKQKGRWVIGTGLRLDCEPKIDALKKLGVNVDTEFAEAFNKTVEELWDVYSNTDGVADFSNRVSLHKIAKRAERNASLRGDVLVVLFVDDNNIVKVQLIDGELVSTPMGLSTVGGNDKLVDNYIGYDFIYTNGNRVRYGVEIDDDGAHVAYHVRNGIGLEWKRIVAKDKRGNLRAYLYTGEEYRLDDPRGIPKISQSMESSKQLDEYTSATVGSAVERQRIPYFIEHERGTEGTDPRQTNLAAIVGGSNQSMDLPVDVNGKQLANTIAVSTNKQTFNMTPGARISTPESKQELHYKEFHETRSDAIAAAADIPPEVASQKFGGSYSASRAATNGFQYSLNIDRDEIGHGFYQPIYNFQLDVWVMARLVEAPGYIEALWKRNELVLGAYRHAKWLGDPVPQIDQLKEVQAARLLLGTNYDHIPLGTAQKVTQDLGKGNYTANVLQAQRELKEAEDAGIEPVEDQPAKEKTHDEERGGAAPDKKAKPSRKR